jgi:hypothetical protein
MLMGIMPALAKVDPQAAVGLLDEIDVDLRNQFRGVVVASLIGQGEDDLGRGRELLMGISNKSERLRAFADAAYQPVGDTSLDAAAAFARSLEFDARGEADALAAIAAGNKDLPAAERGDWLALQLDGLPPFPMRVFVTRAMSADPGISSWVDSLSAGALKDEALAGEVSALAGIPGNGSVAVARAQLIGDERIRSQALKLATSSNPDATGAAERSAAEIERANNNQ